MLDTPPKLPEFVAAKPVEKPKLPTPRIITKPAATLAKLPAAVKEVA